MTDDEDFYAWLDGELAGEQAEAVAARVAASPELTELARQHRAMGAQLRAAFDGVATPAPARITGDVVPFAAPRPAANENRRLPAWTALAATLVVGLVAGAMIPLASSGTKADPIEVAGGRMIAAAALDQALDTQLASAGGNPDVRIGLTFRNADGRWCRSFDGLAGAGLACRDKDDWKVEALFPSTAGGDYRMAAGADPRLSAVVDGAMSGDAVGAQGERAARDAGWR